jgi:isochorismate hydrolase
MRHSKILTQEQALLLIIDVQEGFRTYLPNTAELIKNIGTLAQGCRILDVPILVTEQYPKGLGKTLSEIVQHLGEQQTFDKNCFSCCGSAEFMQALKATGRRQIIVTGIEAHVCVNQTVHDLLAADFVVHIVVDAISSRSSINKEVGMQKMLASGAVPSTVEMALFEMLVQSGTETFKAVQRLVK